MADLIERKDALDCLDNRDFDSYEDYSRTFDAIEDIPSVNRWIPCSERLPENDAKCLVYFDRRVAMARWYGNYGDQGAWYIISDDVPKLYRIKNVPYWMPMPEPPEGGAKNG